MAYTHFHQDNKNRQQSIVWIFIIVAAIYIIRLFFLQILDDTYKESADSNAFLKKTLYPSRGLIYDRKGRLMVSNQPVYDVMLVMREMQGFDTINFCNTLDITREEFDERIAAIKDRRKNRSYSRYTPQLFMSQLSGEDYGRLQEKLFRFPGVLIQQRVLREYSSPHGAVAMGSIGEVSQAQIDADSYYRSGDYKGQSGIELMYEKVLRGEKGYNILLRDVHGRTKGSYRDGAEDVAPKAGKNLTTGIDMELQEYGERLMNGKMGSIVAIEPKTGEILALVSAPSFDPSLLVGRKRSANYMKLLHDKHKPLFDRPVQAQYPPGSTFKLVQSLVMQQEGIIHRETRYPCYQGYFYTKGHKLGCHNHASPLNLPQAITNSCNAYYCYCLRDMLDNIRKYGSTENAYNIWRDHVTSLGFGTKLGVDFPNEKNGLILKSDRYNRIYGAGHWHSSTIISISIGQGEVLATPIQIANLAATIANKGYYITPHIVKAIEDGEIERQYVERHYSTIDSVYFDVVHEGMLGAVEGGTARIGRIPGINICGKTGTAQNPHGKDHSIFMAFAPMEDPKIAIAVYVENAGFGATWAVPIASFMIEKYLNDTINPSRSWLEDKMLNTSLISE